MNSWLGNRDASRFAAYGVYSQKIELQHVVQSLNQAGLSDKDICLLLAPAHPLAGLARDHMLLSSGADQVRASQLFHWLLRLGAVSIPRAGCFVRSRNFLQAFMDEPSASARIRNATAVSMLGISESDAHRLAGLIGETGGFVYVSCSQVEQSQYVREILSHTGAEEAACLH